MKNKLLITHYSLILPTFRPLVPSLCRSIVLSFFFLILFPLAVSAQLQPPGYQAEFGSILQAGNMKPFWMISNQGGKVHPDNSSLFGKMVHESVRSRTSFHE